MGTLSSYCIILAFAVASEGMILFHLLTPFNAITKYQPRKTNVISDCLADQASAWIRNNQHDPQCSGEPFSLPVDPPCDLLLEANAVILGPHVAGKVVLILQETLGCNLLQLAACLRWNNGSHVAAIRSLALATQCYYITDSGVHYVSQ